MDFHQPSNSYGRIGCIIAVYIHKAILGSNPQVVLNDILHAYTVLSRLSYIFSLHKSNALRTVRNSFIFIGLTLTQWANRSLPKCEFHPKDPSKWFSYYINMYGYDVEDSFYVCRKAASVCCLWWTECSIVCTSSCSAVSENRPLGHVYWVFSSRRITSASVILNSSRHSIPFSTKDLRKSGGSLWPRLPAFRIRITLTLLLEFDELWYHSFLCML